MTKSANRTLSRTQKAFLGILLLISTLPALVSLNLLFHSRSINRASLGILPTDEMAACPRTIPTFYNSYVSERAANDHLIYAIASNEAYGDAKLRWFIVNKYDNNFSKLASGEHQGLHYEAYIKETGIPTVLVALRGTRLTSWRDWFANFSWFTGLIPIENEYTVARREFASIRQLVKNRFGNKAVSYVVTGHSLGGGLAQHIAAAFPCVDAVVFDASFVTNIFILTDPFAGAITVHIYDKDDELTRLRHLLFSETDSSTYRWYPIKLVPCKTGLCHPMTPFVIGMARAAVECQIGRPKDCLIPKTDTRAQNTYCPSADGINDRLCRPVLRRLSIGQ